MAVIAVRSRSPPTKVFGQQVRINAESVPLLTTYSLEGIETFRRPEALHEKGRLGLGLGFGFGFGSGKEVGVGTGLTEGCIWHLHVIQYELRDGKLRIYHAFESHGGHTSSIGGRERSEGPLRMRRLRTHDTIAYWETRVVHAVVVGLHRLGVRVEGDLTGHDKLSFRHGWGQAAHLMHHIGSKHWSASSAFGEPRHGSSATSSLATGVTLISRL